MPARRSVTCKRSASSAEVIDPIWLSPLDIDTIAESVEQTGRLLVVDNGWLCCGAGRGNRRPGGRAAAGRARPAAAAASASRRRPVPTTPALEDLFYPNARTIAAAARDLVEGRASGWLPEERSDLQNLEFKGPF